MKNRSITYLLPLTVWKIPFNKKAIVNSYIYSIHEPEYNIDTIKGLFIELEYKYESKETFKFNARCLYIKDIDAYTFLIYLEAPDFITKDMERIIEGKYSTITSFSKKEITSFHNITENNNYKIWQILNKDEKLRNKMNTDLDTNISEKAELASVFDLEKEVFSKKIMDKVIEND
jgi:hypothetical protein